MSTNALTTTQVSPGAIVAPFPAAAEWDSMRNAAAVIARSGLVPEAFRGKVEDVMVALLMARGLGLDPMVALQKGYVVKGRFDVEVSVKLGLAQARVPDFDYEVVQLDDLKATVRGGRRGRTPVTVTFTYAQAEKAGLTRDRNGNAVATWANYRQDMMLYRALGRVLKLTCASALYNMPVNLEEYDEAEVPATPSGGDRAAGAERSEATVVEGGPNPEGAPVQTLPPSPPVAEPPVDWQGRLLTAVASHYGITPPGPHKNAYAKWAKANGEKLGRLLNLYYEAHSEAPVKSWMAVPPGDHKRLAEWIEAKAEKRAGTGDAVPPGGRETAPAPSLALVVEGDAPPLEEPEGELEKRLEAHGWVPDNTPPAWERLSKRGAEGVVTVLLACRHATKGASQFVLKSAKSNRYQLTYGPILKAIGSVHDNGSPASAWLNELADSEVTWLMLCRAVCETAESLGVDID